MSKIIKIEKPYVVENIKDGVFDNGVRLCANISMPSVTKDNQDVEKVLFFEYENRYKKYLCLERSDAFVMGLLSSAMELGYDIYFEEPISEKLYVNMIKYYIPIITKHNKKMHAILLKGPLSSDQLITCNKVGTGFSCGVDSLSTVVEYLDKDLPETVRLTHGVYASSSVLINDSSVIKESFKNVFPYAESAAKDFGIDIVGVYNNLHEFYKYPYYAFQTYYASTYAANIYALQHLFSIYYESAGYSILDFSIKEKDIDKNDASIIDSFVVPLLNTESLSFNCTEMDKERNERMAFIMNHPSVKKNLMTCAGPALGDNKLQKRNCGRCTKCTMVLNLLYANELLDDYEQSFDLSYFKSNRAKWTGYFFANGHKQYNKQIKDELKQNGKSVPFTAYLYMLMFNMFNFFATTIGLKNNKRIKALYRRLKIDKLVHGVSREKDI